MAQFDINGARASGYSDAEISQHLLSQPGTEDARKAGYSDTEILSHFGFSPAATSAPTTAPSGTDWNAALALENGLYLGFGPQVGGALAFLGGGDYAKTRDALAAARAGYNKEHPLLGPGLEIGGSIPPVLAANALTPGLPAAYGLAGRVATGAIRGAEAGGLQSGLNDQPVTAGNVLTNIELGAVTGAAFPTAAAGARSAISPAINPLVAQTARNAEALGVDLRPGQIAKSAGTQRVDALLASGGNADQLASFTQAVGRTFGADAKALTPEVMSNARDTLRDRFNAVAGKTSILPDSAFHDGLDTVETASAGLAESERAPVLRIVNDLRERADSGIPGLPQPISGQDYQTLTRHGSPLSLLTRSNDPNSRYMANKLRDVLDSALERSAPADQVQELRDAREAWKNMVAVQPLVEKSQPSGVIDPKQVAGAVRKTFSDYGWTPPGELATLGEAGKFLSSPTVQGEAKGHAVLPWWMKAAGAAGEAGLLLENPEHAAIGLGLGAGAYGAGKTVGMGMGSDWYRNMVLRPGTAPAGVNPLLPAVTGGLTR